MAGSSGYPDLLHDRVDFARASWVDGPALLITSHTADMSGNIVQDGGEGHVDDISLAKGGGNGEFVFLKLGN